MKPKNKAFTLVELLVVISIIALLMAIMMPSLQKARLQAQKLISANNIKNIGTANNVYAGDNDGWCVKHTPIAEATGGGSLGYDSYEVWAPTNTEHNGAIGIGRLVMEGYCPNGKALYSPAWKSKDYQYNGEYGWPSNTELLKKGDHKYVVMNYQYRSTIYDGWDGQISRFPRRTKDIQEKLRSPHTAKDSSRTAVLADGFCFNPVINHGFSWHFKDGSYNVFYMDGHCSVVRDKNQYLATYNNGVPMGTRWWSSMEYVWKFYFAEGANRDID